MNEEELVSRASQLPDQFGPRLPEMQAAMLRKVEGGGEWGILVSDTIAALAKAGAAVTPSERDELRALAEATGEGGEYLEGLIVQG